MELSLKENDSFKLKWEAMAKPLYISWFQSLSKIKSIFRSINLHFRIAADVEFIDVGLKEKILKTFHLLFYKGFYQFSNIIDLKSWCCGHSEYLPKTLSFERNFFRNPSIGVFSIPKIKYSTVIFFSRFIFQTDSEVV